MFTLTKNSISVTVRDRAKRTKIWDNKGFKSQKFKKIQNLIKKIKMVFKILRNAISVYHPVDFQKMSKKLT